ncbi:MAG: transglutaminase domain-containing protein [Candidatus Latescibacteria bacterium]|nr:transglutaminase domain-containing protein [Candidatus Latescibacterota bacterium]
MSRLFHTEEGLVSPSLGEELTCYRRVRKHLHLPATKETAQVYLLARAYPETDSPLHLTLNDIDVAAIEPIRRSFHWYCIDVDAKVLRPGSNTLELWTDSAAMDAWSLALESGHGDPRSEVSDDEGATWRHHHMGYLNSVRAEYVIRIRLAEGEDPPPPPVVWEDPASPRLASLRQQLPAEAITSGSVRQKVRALSSWLASSWEHTGSGRAEQYAPWDAQTLLAWAPRQQGHNGKRPIAMCVHYAAALVSAAQAVGLPARCAVTTESCNGSQGHFIAEVWDAENAQWFAVDPNSDALFVRDGHLMSMTQIQQAGAAIGEHIEWGPGTEFQRTFPHIVEFCDENLTKGVCFGHRSVWYRADLLTRPWLSPPGHGSITYCETGLVWETRDLERGFGMFPAFGTPDWFDAPPVDFPG